MIDSASVVGVILARGGSKALPGKNVLNLAGKPLIAWTIEAGHASRYLDRLIVSTDDARIAAVAEEYGCEVPFRRPLELAQDDTSSVDTLLHALGQLGPYEFVVMLQPTSPLRTGEHIDEALELCVQANAPACVSVVRVDKPPEWMYTLSDDARLRPVLEVESVPSRRQELTPTYACNGGVYVARVDWLRRRRAFKSTETVAYRMPRRVSVDIDDELDFQIADRLIRQRAAQWPSAGTTHAP